MIRQELSFEQCTVQPASEIEVETRRRKFFGRGGVGGEIAVSSAEQKPEDLDLGFSEAFGVGDEIREYAEGWQEYADVISGFISDDTHYETYADVARQNGAIASDRSERRMRDAVLQKDFTDLVTITILAGRVRRTFTQGIIDDVSEGRLAEGKGSIGTTLEANRDFKAVATKHNGILGNFYATPSLDVLKRQFLNFEQAIGNAYKPVLKIEYAMVDKLDRQISDNPARAKELVISFLQACGSDAEEDKEFARFLATQHLATKEHSILSHAMKFVRAGTEKGSIAPEFIKKRMTSDGGDNLFSFFAEVLKGEGIHVSLSTFMSARFEAWPQDLRKAYTEFVTDYVSSLTTGVQRSASQYLEKTWIHPTLDMYEAAVDRMFIRLHRKYAGGIKKTGATTSLRISGSKVLETSDVIPEVAHEKVQEPRTPVILARGINGEGAVWGKDSTIEEVVQKLLPASKKRDQRFVDEVKLLVSNFSKNPFASGAQLLRGQSGNIKFYRINPVHASMPIKAAKQARIVFAVNGEKFGIYSITADHKDYEQVVAGLLKARL